MTGEVVYAVMDAAAEEAKGLTAMDREVLRDMYVRYFDSVKAMAISRLGHDDGLEAVSETFEVLVTKVANGDPLPTNPMSLKAFILTITYRVIGKAYKRRKRADDLMASLADDWWRDPDLGLDPLDVVADNEAARLAFCSLSQPDQEIINLSVWGLSPGQIAEALDVTPSAATTRKGRAFDRLDDALARQGLGAKTRKHGNTKKGRCDSDSSAR